MKIDMVTTVSGILLAGLTGVVIQSAQVPAPQHTSIRGTVTQAGNNQPLQGIRISLSRSDNSPSGSPSIVSTNSGGQFALDGVEPGSYRIRAEGDNFLSQEYAEKVSASAPKITSFGENAESLVINFQLVPTGVIAGRVLSEAGEPVIGAVVQLLHYEYDNGQRSLVQLAGAAGPMPSQTGLTAVTNDLGEYRLFRIPPDEYYLSVIRSKTALVSVVPGVIGRDPEPPIYYPKAFNIETATPLSVNPGAELGGINVTWRANSAVVLRGRIAPPVEGLVHLRTYLTKSNGDGLEQDSIQTSEDSFEIRDVPPGIYNLTTMATNGRGRDYFGMLPVTVGTSDIDNLTVNLQAPRDIRGKVTVISGSIPDPKVWPPLLVKINSTSAPSIKNGASGSSSVMADGTFRLANFSARDWKLSVSEGYLEEARYGSIDILARGGIVNPGQELEGATLNLTVAFEMGSIEGRVVDEGGKTHRSESVTLVPSEPRRNQAGLYFSVPTDNDGNFRFPKVPTGDYKVFAWPGLPSKAYQNLEFLKRYENQGRPIHVTMQGTETVEVKMTVIP